LPQNSLYIPSDDIISQEAIVNVSNERVNSLEGVSGLVFARAGSQLLRAFLDAEVGSDGVRTGDAIRSPGYRLPAAHIIHTIAPRYTTQYHDAAVYALHRCGLFSLLRGLFVRGRVHRQVVSRA
jgi:O-acetyl-ADP-ribose deacetylase (regulator of RNase III)